MNVLNIAIVEDQKEQAEDLKSQLGRYEKENPTEVHFTFEEFANPISFLETYKGTYDIVFMDIAMPYMNGLDAAKRLRAIDPNVILIFVTNLTQYALNGYEVDAFDYVIKNINYYDLALKISKAIKKISHGKKGKEIMILTDNGYIKVPELEIRYVETDGHHVIYHAGDEEYRQYSSLRAIEKNLSKEYFVKCNSSYIINLAFVSALSGYIVTVGGENLEVSHPRKKELLKRLKEFQG